MVNKIWNKQDKCRVWLMEMPDAEKPKRTKGFGDIDKMTVSLLRDKGIRITKSSSITPKGIFKVKNGEGVAGKLDSFKRKIAEKGLMPAGSRNLFLKWIMILTSFAGFMMKSEAVRIIFRCICRVKKNLKSIRKIMTFGFLKMLIPAGR